MNVSGDVVVITLGFASLRCAAVPATTAATQRPTRAQRMQLAKSALWQAGDDIFVFVVYGYCT